MSVAAMSRHDASLSIKPPSRASVATSHPTSPLTTELKHKPLPRPLRAMSLGICPDVQLQFGITGGLHTAHELQSPGRKKHQFNSGYKVTGPATLFNELGKGKSEALQQCNGRLSPLAAMRLDDDARERAGIPCDACYFALAYPANRIDMLQEALDLDEQPWGAMLLNGGFWYFDSERRLLQANTFGPVTANNLAFHFCGPARVTEEAAIRALELQGRMQRVSLETLRSQVRDLPTSPHIPLLRQPSPTFSRVSLETLRSQGMDRFAWVHAMERPGGYPLSKSNSYPFGAFVYVMRTGAACFYALEESNQQLEEAFEQSRREMARQRQTRRMAGGVQRLKNAPATLRRAYTQDHLSTDVLKELNEVRLMHEKSQKSQSVHDTAYLARRRALRNKKPWYILDPYGYLMSIVDTISACALIFTVLVTPYEVAFLQVRHLIRSRHISTHLATPLPSMTFADPVAPDEVAFLQPPSSWFDPLFLANRLVDCFFILDLVLQFFLMYRRDSDDRASDPHADLYEKSLSKIAGHYLRTWFIIDVGSILPSGFDFVIVAQVRSLPKPPLLPRPSPTFSYHPVLWLRCCHRRAAQLGHGRRRLPHAAHRARVTCHQADPSRAHLAPRPPPCLQDCHPVSDDAALRPPLRRHRLRTPHRMLLWRHGHDCPGAASPQISLLTRASLSSSLSFSQALSCSLTFYHLHRVLLWPRFSRTMCSTRGSPPTACAGPATAPATVGGQRRWRD